MFYANIFVKSGAQTLYEAFSNYAKYGNYMKISNFAS